MVTVSFTILIWTSFIGDDGHFQLSRHCHSLSHLVYFCIPVYLNYDSPLLMMKIELCMQHCSPSLMHINVNSSREWEFTLSLLAGVFQWCKLWHFFYPFAHGTILYVFEVVWIIYNAKSLKVNNEWKIHMLQNFAITVEDETHKWKTLQFQ